MATIGYPLTAPESGWKRYDNYGNSEIEWPGFTLSTGYTPDWNKTMFLARPRQEDTVAYIRFNFTGSKLRIISRFDSSASSKIKIIIDGKESLFSQEAASRIDQALCFEIVDLESTEHSVIIQPAELSKTVTLDAIDIDVNGGLKPYNPIESEPNIPVPINLVATAGDSQVTLSWDAVTGATGYNVKRSTTAGGPYTTIASNVSGTSYVDTGVVNGTTYYYVVTAITADGESANSNEASATPTATETPGESSKALLRVTMTDSSEREYKLSIAEINDFMAWMDRPATAGTSFYTFNKSITDSKDYLLFDKIISFEVAKFK
ncbi:fibronectin type III domain-containing protein [Anaerospora hongkongensis]|uniref:fibronectin type III domain-containing protein n=1 Tax=Anaerospora hongkongensis TaxID=244830 RepID=UPI002897828D|nr:fibronectin type III domain-containing protein [Anaerospora hongkongensis]